MICTHCGVDHPDHSISCPNCGRPRASEALSSQPLETSTYVPSPEQQSFMEQPTFQQQTNVPGPAFPLSGNQLWEAFGPGASLDRQSVPDHETPSEIPQMLTLEPNLPIDNRETTMPLPTAHTPWPRVLESRFGKLAKPLPLWASIPAILVVVCSIIGLQLAGSDWASGAMHAALVAGIIALLLALGTGVRTLVGMRRLSQFISAGLAVLLLLVFSVAGITQQSSIHRLQANSLEGQQQWQRAIAEYQLAGEHAPTSDNIARTYIEWGEQLSTGQHYEAAMSDFDTVLNSYGSATSEVTRAQSDKIGAFLAWGKQAMQQKDYTTATTHFNDLANLPYCNSNCQAQANALNATASYNLARTELLAQQYTDASNVFQLILVRFPNSTEAQQLHPDFARALLGQGKQMMTTACSSAIPIYQELSTKFADTPEGQQATSTLKAPQPVKGHFVTPVPNNPALTLVAALMQGLHDNTTNDQFFVLLGVSPTTKIQSDGSFSFKPVKQGTYDLVWGTNNSDGSQSYSSIKHSVSLDFVVTVGPLCPYDFGDINEPIPQAP